MSYPATYDIDAPQGATLNKILTWEIDGTPVDLTNCTARMQVRPDTSSDDTYLSLTSSSGITLGGSFGTITINVTATQTSAIPAGQWFYDLEIVNGATVTRLISGRFFVSGEVTR